MSKTKLVKKIFNFTDEGRLFYTTECGISGEILDQVKGKLVTVELNKDEDENNLVKDFFDIIRYRKNQEPIKLEVWGEDLHPYTPKNTKPYRGDWD